MSTANEIVTDAFRLLHAIDIAEAAPDPAETTAALRTLNKMLDSWAAQNLNVSTQILSGNSELDSAVITGLSSTAKLAPTLNVSGTGIPASTRIKTVDSLTQITLDTPAIASGSAVDLTFTAIPFDPRFEEGVAALLAKRVALLIGEDNIPALVIELANEGWKALMANFIPVPKAGFDPMLTNTSAQRMSSESALP